MTGERHASFADAADMTLPQFWNLSQAGAPRSRSYGSLADMAAERRRRGASPE